MIHHGDLFDVLPTLPDASIDACVTDPPYELAFMGKRWDNTGVAFRVETWREVFRVLKPGAHLVAFGGTRTFHRMTSAIEDAGFEIRDCLSWLYGSGFPKSLNLPGGLGTALKPSWEPIVLARKSAIGTVAANVQKHGTAALNINACRLEGVPPSVPQPVFNSPTGRTYGFQTGEGRNGEMSQATLGRWPANVCLDEEAAVLLDEQSGYMSSHGGGSSRGIGYGSTSDAVSFIPPGDSGGASRFYYVAKPSQEERSMGNVRNVHPTVKPVELMRWLVRLVTPPCGTVLDPFTGSGTTGMACRYELREFVGIEREAEYVAIAERRIAAVAPLFHSEAVAGAETEDEPRSSGGLFSDPVTMADEQTP